MPCGHKTTPKTSRRLSAATKAKIAATERGKKGKPLSAAARRKISDSLKCYYAAKGTCKKDRPASAYKTKASQLKKRVVVGRVCTASPVTRHSASTARRTYVVYRRHVIRAVRTAQRTERLEWTGGHVSTSSAMVRPHLTQALRLLQQAQRAGRKRQRSVHQQRLYCHNVYRKSAPKVKASSRCPKSK